MFLSDVELSDAQQEQLSALKKDKRSTRESRKAEKERGLREHRGEQAWIAAFADGEKSRRQILREIESASRTKFKPRKSAISLGCGLNKPGLPFSTLTALISELRSRRISSSSGTRCQSKQEARLEKMEAKVAKHQRKSQKDSSAFVP